MVEPALVSRAIGAYAEHNVDYVSTVLGEETWPVGSDVEVFATDTLAAVDGLTRRPRDREHVSLYIYEHPQRFQLLGLQAEGAEQRPDLRLTLDTEEDYVVLSALYEALWQPGQIIQLGTAIEWLDAHPEIADINRETAK